MRDKDLRKEAMQRPVCNSVEMKILQSRDELTGERESERKGEFEGGQENGRTEKVCSPELLRVPHPSVKTPTVVEHSR
jgi:hypothetical protein